MSFKFLRRLKETQLETDFENVVCSNCETQFSGHFCPNCGQAVKEYDKPFSFVFYNFLGDFFAFDIRFFRTIVALLFKPGYLSKEYIEGRRVRFAPPFRIFVFVSFVLFLLLQVYTNRGLTTVLDSSLSEMSEMDGVRIDSVSIAALDSIITENKNEFVTDTGQDSSDINLLDLETFRDTRDLRKTLNIYANKLENDLDVEEDPKERAKLREYIGLCRSPEQGMAKILQYISWAFFLLLPIFALVLKLVYIRRKHNYMRHLIFSIHIHSFIFFVMIFVVGFYMVFSGNLEWITSILLFAIPVYFIIALKRFYGQTIGKVVLKFLAVSFLYNIIFVIVVLSAALNALNLI